MIRLAGYLVMGLIAVCGAAIAQPQMVRDINPGPDGQGDLRGVVGDGRFFFGATEGIDGYDGWVSDGTLAGTRIVFSSSPSGRTGASMRAAYGGRIWFNAFHPDEGVELWSFVSPSGTPVMHDIRPGPGSATPSWLGIVGGTPMLAAAEVGGARELYRINADLTASLVVDINMIASGSNPSLLLPTGPNSALLAAMSEEPPYIGAKPHRLVGNTAMEIRSDDDYRLSVRGPAIFPVANGALFFAQREDVDANEFKGIEPWLIPPAAEVAVPVADINPGAASSYSQGAVFTGTVIDGWLYFAAVRDGEGREPWRSNGGGAELIGDIVPGERSSEPTSFVEYKNEVYFGAKTPHGPQLWKTDGSVTQLLATIGTDVNADAPRPLGVFDGHLIFTARTHTHGVEYWAANGEVGGVALVADIWPGSGNGVTLKFFWPISDERMLFAGNDGVHGEELWRLDAGYLDSLFAPIFVEGFECSPFVCP